MIVCVSDLIPQLENATQFQIYIELLSSTSHLPLRAGMNKWSNDLQDMLKGTLGLFPLLACIFKAQSSNLDGDIPISCISTLNLTLVFQRTADDK